jgi:hypothetical protein
MHQEISHGFRGSLMRAEARRRAGLSRLSRVIGDKIRIDEIRIAQK